MNVKSPWSFTTESGREKEGGEEERKEEGGSVFRKW
jgi:hypothetical protein